MPEYIDIPIETSPETLAQDAFDYLQTVIPGWLPSEGNPEVWMIEAVARMVAELRELTTQVPVSIFRYFGNTVVGLPPVDATSASCQSTWTAQDNAGYTIEEGTLVGLRTAGDELQAFSVLNQVIITPGSTATAAGEVTLSAVEPGEEANDIASATPGELIDTLSYITGIVTTTATAGGLDAETDETYLNRLASQLQLLAPRPIVPEDFAVLARTITGVARAIAIDGWDHDLQTGGHEKTITVGVIDSAGNDLSAGIKAEVDALLQAEREVNFVVYVVNPVRTGIDVTIVGTAYDGWVLSDVEANVTAAIQSFLNPATWALPRFGDQLKWIDDREVRYLELAEAINSAEGFHYIDSLTFRISGGYGTVDLTLSGVPALPFADELDVTVNAP